MGDLCQWFLRAQGGSLEVYMRPTHGWMERDSCSIAAQTRVVTSVGLLGRSMWLHRCDAVRKAVAAQPLV